MIYFIRSGKKGAIKIGYSKNNIKDRMGELQVGSPELLTLIGVMEGNINKEKELHRKFKKYLIRGEWFRPSAEIKNFIFENSDPDFDVEYTSNEEMITGGIDLDEMINDIQINYIKRALDLTGGHKQKAAQLLGISFRTFRYRVKKLNIT
ncbi:MAG: GIY-YIG nuclease family protein [Deltaproteobacteria bacterium]|nr:GIY-YIG nuclease family protein [Deltaproteobacteria bacterium]